MERTDWSGEFNALPKRTRIIGSAMECRTRIQQLGFERERVKVAYDKRMKDIAVLMKRHEARMVELEGVLRDET